MTRRIRLLAVVARPPVLVLLALFAATGVEQAGGKARTAMMTAALVATFGFLLFSVAVNDLSDERIDRMNLPGDARRPLVVGSATRIEMGVVAVTAAALALGAGLVLGPAALAVVASGLAVSAGYSIPPVRLADRGIVASLVLPACYVVVPYMLGLFSVRSAVHGADVVLLAALYVGFVGRILLKDFRDVRGDALFGKRTFLVRHGRAPTCVVSAGCWSVSTIGLLGVRGATRELSVLLVGSLLAVVALLARLARNTGGRRDEALISTIAILGRSTIAVVATHLAVTAAGWGPLPAGLLLAGLALGTGLQAWAMLVRGPVTRLTVPEHLGGAPSADLRGAARSEPGR